MLVASQPGKCEEERHSSDNNVFYQLKHYFLFLPTTAVFTAYKEHISKIIRKILEKLKYIIYLSKKKKKNQNQIQNASNWHL